MQKWVKSVIDIFSHSKRSVIQDGGLLLFVLTSYHCNRKEIKALRELRKPQRDKKKMITVSPKADNREFDTDTLGWNLNIIQAGFKALVEENVKQSVDSIKKHSVLSTVSPVYINAFPASSTNGYRHIRRRLSKRISSKRSRSMFMASSTTKQTVK